MDREIIDQKLETLRRCVQRVAEKCPADADALQGDVDVQDIIALNLTRAVQVCVDIGTHVIATLEVPPPDSMGQTFDMLAQAGILDPELAVRMKKAVGFRNIAVHNYETIDWLIVHNIAKHHLGDFAEFARAIAAKLG